MREGGREEVGKDKLVKPRFECNLGKQQSLKNPRSVFSEETQGKQNPPQTPDVHFRLSFTQTQYYSHFSSEVTR